jgi:hypothetical protein
MDTRTGTAMTAIIDTESHWRCGADADEQVQRRYFDAAVKRLGLRHRAPKQARFGFATICLLLPY